MDRLEVQVEQSIRDLHDKLKINKISEFASAMQSAIKSCTKGATSPTLVLADIAPITAHIPTEAQLEHDCMIQAEVDTAQFSPEDEVKRKYWKVVVGNGFKDIFINMNTQQKAKYKCRHCCRDKKGRFI